jgi:phage tail sheath protein FI
MPEYLSPGVYVEEFEIGARPIEGVSTSTAGFLGETLRGPENPRFITGFEQFKRIYGGYLNNNRFLAYAADGFFSNGGQRCFVGRIIGNNAAAAQGGPIHPLQSEPLGLATGEIVLP